MQADKSFRNLSHGDLRQIMQICEQLHLADPQESFLPHCHRVIDEAFACVHHSSEIYALDPFGLTELENPTISTHWLEVFNQYVHEHPYVTRMFSSQPRHLEVLQHEAKLQEFKTTALYNEFYNKVQGQNHLWMAYRDGNELLSCVFLREAAFSERELAMSRLIHPHLETAWKNWKRVKNLQSELMLLKESIFLSEEEEAAAAAVRRRMDALTTRQQDVAELVAAGMDNQQISDALSCSVGTVKKHLQAIFNTLSVQHRTQLAAKWHQAHSVSVY